MDSNTGQTFIEEMQPNFDALPERREIPEPSDESAAF